MKINYPNTPTLLFEGGKFLAGLLLVIAFWSEGVWLYVAAYLLGSFTVRFR